MTDIFAQLEPACRGFCIQRRNTKFTSLIGAHLISWPSSHQGVYYLTATRLPAAAGKRKRKPIAALGSFLVDYFVVQGYLYAFGCVPAIGTRGSKSGTADWIWSIGCCLRARRGNSLKIYDRAIVANIRRLLFLHMLFCVLLFLILVLVVAVVVAHLSLSPCVFRLGHS